MVAIESVDGTYRARRGSRVVQVALYKCMYYYKTSYIRTFFCHAAKVSVRAKRHTSTVYAQCARSTLSAFCGYVRERLASRRCRRTYKSNLKKNASLRFPSKLSVIYSQPRRSAIRSTYPPSVTRPFNRQASRAADAPCSPSGWAMDGRARRSRTRAVLDPDRGSARP